MGQVITTPKGANSYRGSAERDPVVTFILPVRNRLLVRGENPAWGDEHPTLGELFPKLHLQCLGRLLTEPRMRVEVKLQLEEC